jgi:hypothetical protein
MTTRMATRLVAGLCAAAGLYVLGWVTAHHDPDRKSRDAAYARGVGDGRVQGLRDGRADLEVRSLPAGARDSAKAAFDNGYQAGANEVFTGYDGGWSYATPYIVTLARGGAGVTYRLASRTPLQPGVAYYLCPGSIRLCQAPRR